MARINQAKWYADFILTADFYRSFEAGSMGAGPAYPIGQLMNINYTTRAVSVATATNTNAILMRAVEARTATTPVLVLARDAEVTDAYIVPGAATGWQESLRTACNIIVREGVLPSSIPVPGSVEAGDAPETDPPAEPAAA